MPMLIDFIIIAVALWAIVGAGKRICGGYDNYDKIEDKKK